MTKHHIPNDQVKAWRHSLRQHCDIAALDQAINATSHWLLKTACGRDLLVQKLRQVRPGVRYSIWTCADAIDPLLEAMVDELGVRKKQKPKGLRQHFLYLCWVAEQGLLIHGSRSDVARSYHVETHV